MEDNQNNVQNEVNNVEQKVSENKLQKSGKGKTIVLMIIVLLLVLAIGLGGGYLLSNKNSENSTNNTINSTTDNTTNITTNTTDNTTNTANTDISKNNVVGVIDENKDNELRDQMTIAKKDENGNVIWRYTTLKSNIPVERSNSGLNLIGTNNGKVYLCDWGNLYILDEQTGKVLKSNVNIDEKIGYATANAFDKDNNLYTVSYPMYLRKIDENGNFLCSTGELWDKGLIWPKSLKIENDTLIAEYYEGTAKVALGDLSIKEISYNTNENQTSNSNNISYKKEYIKIIEKVQSEYPNTDIQCDLIYFNNDDIPDLVIGIQGYWVSLYIYENGTVYNPIKEWSYGMMGNTGYMYLEKKGIVSNHNSDFAGAISTDSILILNSKKEFDTLLSRGEGATMPEDFPDNEAVKKDLEETSGYYYNGDKLTEEQYNNKLNELSIDKANFKQLDGSKNIEDVKKQLQ